MRFEYKFIVLFLVLAAAVLNVQAMDAGKDYGLSFRSHSSNPEDRTGLDLNLGGEKFHGFMAIEFDARFREEVQNFGYVFRMISGSSSVDMVSNIETGRINFVFINQHQAVGNLDFGGLVHLEKDRWYHIRVEISPENGIVCSVDSASLRSPVDIIDMNDMKILFGRNDDPSFFTTDVSSVTVRNIKLSDESGVRYFWPLTRHNGDHVYDKVKGKPAVSRNGDWEIDRHCIWDSLLVMRTAGLPMVSYDRNSSRLFISVSDSMYIYDLNGRRTVSAMKVTGTPVRRAVNQMVYDPVNDRLISYSMHNSDLAFFDFGTASWTGSFDETWPPLTGHGTYYDSDSSLLYLFGGYGNHIYSADLTEIDVNTGERTVTDLSAYMWPRYFSAFCTDNNGDFLVLGGYGSRSGLQEESPMVLNDIVRIDRDTKECSIIGRFNSAKEPLLFSSSMVYDSRKDRMYALVFNNIRFNTAFSLVSVSPQEDSLTYYASPVRYSFHDTDAYAELVFSRDSSTLYAIVVNALKNGTNEIDVMALEYPPVSADEAVQKVPVSDGKSTLWLIGLVVFLAVAVSGVTVIVRKRYNSRMREEEMLSRDRKFLEEALVEAGAETVSHLPDMGSAEPETFTITFLGSFKVCDRTGNDISSRFSSKMRALLQYLLLRTAATGEKVTTEELSDVFWFGIDRSDQTNSRNVYFRKLRAVFQDIGDINIVVEKNLVMLKMGSDVSCDYLKVLPLLESLDSSNSIDLGTLEEVLHIVSEGQLLPGYEYDWLDKFKGSYSELVISALTRAASDRAVSGNMGYLSKIADIILREDSIDEFAIRLKCRILCEDGHKGMAQTAYDKWVSDYRRIMGSDPDLKYSDIL